MDAVNSPAAVLLAADHRELWLRLNDTAADISATTVGERLWRQVAERPERPAVLAARRSLTYRELAAHAQPVAQRLRASGAPVAVCAEPGWEQVAAVAAAAMAGVPFYAIDPAASQPVRWRRIRESGAEMVLTQSWLDERLRWPDHTTPVAIDATAPSTVIEAEQPAVPPAAPADTWCLLVPPEPDGRPLPLTHDAVVNTAVALARQFQIGDRDRALLVTPLGDPAALFAIVGMLLAGGAVVVPDDIDLHIPGVWFDLIRREQVTIWHATPTLSGLFGEHLHGRGESAPEQLRLALIGGEPLPPSLVDRLRQVAPGMRVANLGPGGPAGLWATCLEVEDPAPGEGHVPIGTPLANKRAYVLTDAMTPCPAWVNGRVYVGGRGLPASAGLVTLESTGESLYRTDLIGRLLPDGTLDVIGEDATSISVHGHPLNLRDIEAKLAAHPEVLRAAVIPYGHGSAGFVKMAGGSHVTGADLLDDLRRKMSPYLLPAQVDRVGAFALSPDGRLDRAALSAHAEPPATEDNSTPGGPGTGQVSTELVQRACQLAAAVLGISDVEEHMNLLDLGATSVQLVRLATRAEQELGIEADIEELLRFPSVAVLVSLASQVATEPAAPPPPAADRLLPDLILDPVDRQAFKDRRPGIRRDLGALPGVALPYREFPQLGRRGTHRRFAPVPVPGGQLAALLGALLRLDAGGADTPIPADPKYAYPSAGGLYPVQTYVTVIDQRVDGVAGGAYYLDPGAHRMLTLTNDDAEPASAHAWINREAFRGCAFSLYLVADRDAIEPMYGNRSRDYCLIEAGAMCQLLMTIAAELGLGLCPIGEMDETEIRGRLRLAEQHEVMHVLLGGVPAAEERP